MVYEYWKKSPSPTKDLSKPIETFPLPKGIVPKFSPGGGGTPTPAPDITPPPELPEAEVDTSTLAGRYVAAGVAPKQPGMSSKVSQEMLKIMKQRDVATAELQAAMPGMSQQEMKTLIERAGAEPGSIPGLGIGTNPLEAGTALGAGMGGAVVGAKFGAAAGTAIAPGVGTAVGTALGAVGGFVTATLIKLASSEKQNVKEANAIYTTAKTNMDKILYNLNHGFTTKQQAVEDWVENKQMIYASQRFLKERTQNVVNDMLGDPGDDLIKVNSFLDYTMPSYDLEFEMAMRMPNPAYVANFPTQTEVVA